MKIKVAAIKKQIRELGYNVEDFDILGGRIETRLTQNDASMDRGNQQVERVVEVLCAAQSCEWHGGYTGYGTLWARFGPEPEESKLA